MSFFSSILSRVVTSSPSQLVRIRTHDLSSLAPTHATGRPSQCRLPPPAPTHLPRAGSPHQPPRVTCVSSHQPPPTCHLCVDSPHQPPLVSFVSVAPHVCFVSVAPTCCVSVDPSYAKVGLGVNRNIFVPTEVWCAGVRYRDYSGYV